MGFFVWREGPQWAIRHPQHGFVDADTDLQRLRFPQESPYLPLLRHLGLVT